MLSGRVPLRHTEERCPVHDNAAVAPKLLRDPLHHVIPVTTNLQAKVVALNSSRTPTSAHINLHKYVTAFGELFEVTVPSAIDVVLRGFENGRCFGLEM